MTEQSSANKKRRKICSVAEGESIILACLLAPEAKVGRTKYKVGKNSIKQRPCTVYVCYAGWSGKGEGWKARRRKFQSRVIRLPSPHHSRARARARSLICAGRLFSRSFLPVCFFFTSRARGAYYFSECRGITSSNFAATPGSIWDLSSRKYFGN